MAAATRALAAGTTLNGVIALLKRVSPTIKAPIVLFTYYNPIYQKGFETFVKEIVDAGAKGLLVPDIPLEETAGLSKLCKVSESSEALARDERDALDAPPRPPPDAHARARASTRLTFSPAVVRPRVRASDPVSQDNGIDLVLLSTPTTPVERMAKIAEASAGFIYLVSVTGVTGMRTDVESRVEELVTSLKKVTDKPVAVGFGISKGEQAQQVVNWGADGVIVGSALVKALGEAASPEEGLEKFKAMAEELREGSNREGAKPPGSGASFFDRLLGKA